MKAVVFIALLLSSCAVAPPPAPPLHVRHDSDFTEMFRRTSGWVAGDGALSVPLSDGRVLWLFGDSHINDFDPVAGTVPCLFQARNAGMVQAADGARISSSLEGKGPGFRSWFKYSTNADSWFWPLNGFQSGDTVWVYLAALHKTAEGGQWGFESEGVDYWGALSFPQLEVTGFQPLPGFSGITFGVGFVREGEDMYIYGGRRNGLASDLFVARFKVSNPAGEWSFWDGRGWNPNVSAAAPIGRGASNSLHVSKVRNQIVLTTTAFSVACDQGKDIFMATAAKPTGPFSPIKAVFTVDDIYEGHYPFFYFAVAHPESINRNDELLVTYCINGYDPCVSACVNGQAIPDHYRPKAIRVPLKLIGPGF